MEIVKKREIHLVSRPKDVPSLSFGLLDIGKPRSGETVVISGAGGAVGMVAGQIAKIQGCHVIGIAGRENKIDYLVNKLKFDAAINYKNPSFKKS